MMVRTGEPGSSVQQDLDDLVVVGVGGQDQGLHVGSEAGLQTGVSVSYLINFLWSDTRQTAKSVIQTDQSTSEN